MKAKPNAPTVDCFRFHLVGNALCFTLCLGLGITYAYLSFTMGDTVSQALSLIALAIEIVAFAFTVVGLLDPDRFVSSRGGKDGKNYRDFTPKAKRWYVSSTYALWSLLALVELAMILILVFKD